jgi:endonuclease YncB( thermonuclease family)
MRQPKGCRYDLSLRALAATFAVLSACLCASAQGPAPLEVPCGGDELGRGTVARIVDGRTFILADGREVRLAAIEVPALPPTPQAGAPPGGVAARDALAALAGEDQVVLRRAQISSDRYDRLVAFVYTERDGDEIFVQGELIAAGFGRVSDQVGNRNCAAELTSREAAARKAKLGLWADSYYDIVRADNPADVLARRGRFALVEGKVVSARESGATIYLNFGQIWSEDFTVTIQKRNERNFHGGGP